MEEPVQPLSIKACSENWHWSSKVESWAGTVRELLPELQMKRLGPRSSWIASVTSSIVTWLSSSRTSEVASGQRRGWMKICNKVIAWEGFWSRSYSAYHGKVQARGFFAGWLGDPGVLDEKCALSGSALGPMEFTLLGTDIGRTDSVSLILHHSFVVWNKPESFVGEGMLPPNGFKNPQLTHASALGSSPGLPTSPKGKWPCQPKGVDILGQNVLPLCSYSRWGVWPDGHVVGLNPLVNPVPHIWHPWHHSVQRSEWQHL